MPLFTKDNHKFIENSVCERGIIFNYNEIQPENYFISWYLWIHTHKCNIPLYITCMYKSNLYVDIYIHIHTFYVCVCVGVLLYSERPILHLTLEIETLPRSLDKT